MPFSLCTALTILFFSLISPYLSACIRFNYKPSFLSYPIFEPFDNLSLSFLIISVLFLLSCSLMDTVKTSSQGDSNMDMMAMMMQMENNFPEFSEPFYSTSTYPEPDFSVGSFPNPNVFPPSTFINPSASSANNFINNSVQKPCEVPVKLKNPNAFPYTYPTEKNNSMTAMREMIFRIAVMQPIHIDPESIKPPKRRNVKISKDPQSAAARHRRERISERIRILQRLVPGGTKMDTASMLEEAIHYVKFLKKQVQTLEQAAANRTIGVGYLGLLSNANVNYSALTKVCQPWTSSQMVGSMQMLS